MTLEDKKSLRPKDTIKFIGKYNDKIINIKKVSVYEIEPAFIKITYIDKGGEINWFLSDNKKYEIMERKTPFTDEEYKNLWV